MKKAALSKTVNPPFLTSANRLYRVKNIQYLFSLPHDILKFLSLFKVISKHDSPSASLRDKHIILLCNKKMETEKLSLLPQSWLITTKSKTASLTEANA